MLKRGEVTNLNELQLLSISKSNAIYVLKGLGAHAKLGVPKVAEPYID